VQPTSLDHVALWVSGRDRIAALAIDQLGMHVIEETDRFTLIGADARRGKLTLFEADGPRDPGALARIGLRVSSLSGPDRFDLGEGVEVVLVEAETDTEYDLDHVALYSPDPEADAREWIRYGFAATDDPRRVEVGGAFLELVPGDPGETDRPLLNHIAVLVDEAAPAEHAGFEVADVVDAPNTFAVFVWGPGRVKLEYVEHKASFSLR
jgi:catechol 2,3-dioxygenase-like lactoylglutathione lyase family enzyme